jgi:hypothetical protein
MRKTCFDEVPILEYLVQDLCMNCRHQLLATQAAGAPDSATMGATGSAQGSAPVTLWITDGSLDPAAQISDGARREANLGADVAGTEDLSREPAADGLAPVSPSY